MFKYSFYNIIVWLSMLFPFQHPSDSPTVLLHLIFQNTKSLKNSLQISSTEVQQCQCDSPPLLPIGNASKMDTWPCDWVFPFSNLSSGGLRCNNPRPGSSCISVCLYPFLLFCYMNGSIFPYSSSFQLQNTSEESWLLLLFRLWNMWLEHNWEWHCCCMTHGIQLIIR